MASKQLTTYEALRTALQHEEPAHVEALRRDVERARMQAGDYHSRFTQEVEHRRTEAAAAQRFEQERLEERQLMQDLGIDTFEGWAAWIDENNR